MQPSQSAGRGKQTDSRSNSSAARGGIRVVPPQVRGSFLSRFIPVILYLGYGGLLFRIESPHWGPGYGLGLSKIDGYLVQQRRYMAE